MVVAHYATGTGGIVLDGTTVNVNALHQLLARSCYISGGMHIGTLAQSFQIHLHNTVVATRHGHIAATTTIAIAMKGMANGGGAHMGR